MLRFATLLTLLVPAFGYYHGAPCQAIYSMFPNHDNLLMQNSSINNRYLLTVVNADSELKTTTYQEGGTYKKFKLADVDRKFEISQNEPWLTQSEYTQVLQFACLAQGSVVSSCKSVKFDLTGESTRCIGLENSSRIKAGKNRFTVVEEKERFWTNQIFPSGRLSPRESENRDKTRESAQDENELKSVRRKQPKQPHAKKTAKPRAETTISPKTSTTRSNATTTSISNDTNFTTVSPQSNTTTSKPSTTRLTTTQAATTTLATNTSVEIKKVSSEKSSELDGNVTLIDFAIDRADVEKDSEDELIERIFSEIKDVVVAKNRNKGDDRLVLNINIVSSEPKTPTDAPDVPKAEQQVEEELDELAQAIEKTSEPQKDVEVSRKIEDQESVESMNEPDQPSNESDEEDQSGEEQIEAENEEPQEPEEIDLVTEPMTRPTEAPTTTSTMPPTTPTTTTTPATTTTPTPTTLKPTTPKPTTPRPKASTTTPPRPEPTTSRATESTTPAETRVIFHEKCDKDYWLECNEWSDSECELIWVRQNCRVKCCEYLLRHLTQ